MMTTHDPHSTGRSDDVHDADEQRDGIKDQNWAIVDPGSEVVTSDCEKFGTVREKMPHYLTLRARRNLLSEIEMYLPRDFIDRVDGDRIVLSRSAAELAEMDLTVPPALKESTAE